MKFDVLIGNPPFQEVDQKGNRKQLSHNLYSKFLLISFNIAKEGGVVALIMPISWMSPSAKAAKSNKKEFKAIFKKYNILYLNINNIKAFDKIGSIFSYFVIKKNEYIDLTQVECRFRNKLYRSRVKLGNIPWFPMLLNKESISILSKTCWSNHKKLNVKNSNFYHPVVVKANKQRKLSSHPTKECIYPLYHTNKIVKYGNQPHDNQYDKKVLFSKSGYFKPVYNENYGTTDAAFWITVSFKQEADRIIKLLNSKLFTFILTISKWSGFNMPEVIFSLPDVDLDTFTDSEIYKYFNLSEKEIQLIEKTVQ